MRCLLSNSVAKDLAQIVRNSPLEVPLLWGNPERLRGLPGYSCANEAHTLQMLSSSFARVVAGIPVVPAERTHVPATAITDASYS